VDPIPVVEAPVVRGLQSELKLARARDGGEAGGIEGGGRAVVREPRDRAAEAERARGRDLFGPPPRTEDRVGRLRRRPIGAGEEKRGAQDAAVDGGRRETADRTPPG
jgi:hypothetical protein